MVKAKRRAKRKTLHEQLAEAIKASGKLQRHICVEAGIAEPLLSRFLSGQRGLTLDTVDRLADALGLELVKRKGR